jgi:hypothetical protein
VAYNLVRVICFFVGVEVLTMGDFFMSIEELLAYEPPLGIHKETILAALYDLDAIALERLIQACLRYMDSYIYEHYVFHITERAKALNNQASLEAMKLILAHDDNEQGHAMAIWTLSELQPLDKVLPILREALNHRYKHTYRPAAIVIFELHYQSKPEAAIMDEHAHVRLFAAEEAERQGADSTILKALHHEDTALRRLAAWYCGRKKLQDTFEGLIQQLKRESDSEALRGMIWSLGVLRKPEAKKELEPFLKHPEVLIVQTVEEALSKLAAKS